MVRRLAWDFPPGGDAHAMVSAIITAALDEGGYGAAVVFGKSLGSMAGPVVAERGTPAVWFTPLLTNPDVVAGLRHAEGPFLLAGATADEYWDGRLARSLTQHFVEVADAGHGMFVPGDLGRVSWILGWLGVDQGAVIARCPAAHGGRRMTRTGRVAGRTGRLWAGPEAG